MSTIRSTISSSGSIESTSLAAEALVARGRVALLEAAAKSGGAVAVAPAVGGEEVSTDVTSRVHFFAKSVESVALSTSARLGVSADAAESFAVEAACATPPRLIAAPFARGLARVARFASLFTAETGAAAAQASTLPLTALPRALVTHMGNGAWYIVCTITSMLVGVLITLVASMANIFCGARSRTLVKRVAAATPTRATTALISYAETVTSALPTQVKHVFTAADQATGEHMEQMAEAFKEGVAVAAHAKANKTD